MLKVVAHPQCPGVSDGEWHTFPAPPLCLIPPQIFGFLVCMGVILAIGNAIWEHEVGTRFQVYLPWDEAVDSAFFSGFLSFWSYIIILNTVVPISLYVRYTPPPSLWGACVGPGGLPSPAGAGELLDRELLDRAASSPWAADT